MTPLPFVFPYALIFWGIMFWAFSPEFHILRRGGRSARAADSPDGGSIKVLVIGMQIVFITAFPLSWMRSGRFQGNSIPVFMIGLVLLICGSLLRRHCWRMLGASFTGDVQAHEGQKIVASGAYRLLRHPSYTAGIIMYAGIGLGLGSWVSTLLFVAGSVVTYMYRITVEERVLLKTIGEPYLEFMKTRKRLIPYLY
jgi:protein-S-isoprenylcysteine O-methyltransferase Ste14